MLSPALPELAPEAEAAWACSVLLILKLPSLCGALPCPALPRALFLGQLCLIPATWVGLWLGFEIWVGLELELGLGLTVQIMLWVLALRTLWAHAHTLGSPATWQQRCRPETPLLFFPITLSPPAVLSP